MELIDTFVPPTIDFTRQPIEQDRQEYGRRQGASEAADILSQVSLMQKPKAGTEAIYGSVSSADIVQTIRAALAHNDEAARVLLSEDNVNFITGHEEGDTTRVKQLGMFKVEIQVTGVEKALTRNIRIRAKA
jgi:ribosomal protein L9